MNSAKLKTRWMFGIATTLLAVAGFAAARPAQALPQNSAVRTFYSTAAKTHIVGHQDLLYCEGGRGPVEGTKTNYYTTVYMPCP